MGTVIVLGAKGRFGREAARAFAAAGWQVRRAGRGLDGPNCVDLDATDTAAVVQACQGVDVIVHAVNPAYQHWARVVPQVTQAVVAAARSSDATVMIPGNVYNYGTVLPPVLREETPWIVNTRKGDIRIRMESAFRDSGVRTIVLRSGDFLATEDTGGWFESHITAKVHEGKMTYPGPLDQIHAWAYLPDITRAMVGLAELRRDFAQFEEFGFAGFSLTGAEMVAAVSTVLNRPIKVSKLPWAAVRVMGLWSPLMREVYEMRYLWRRPHVVDGAKIGSVLPRFEPTELHQAIAASLPKSTGAYVAGRKIA